MPVTSILKGVSYPTHLDKVTTARKSKGKNRETSLMGETAQNNRKQALLGQWRKTTEETFRKEKEKSWAFTSLRVHGMGWRELCLLSHTPQSSPSLPGVTGFLCCSEVSLSQQAQQAESSWTCHACTAKLLKFRHHCQQCSDAPSCVPLGRKSHKIS